MRNVGICCIFNNCDVIKIVNKIKIPDPTDVILYVPGGIWLMLSVLDTICHVAYHISVLIMIPLFWQHRRPEHWPTKRTPGHIPYLGYSRHVLFEGLSSLQIRELLRNCLRDLVPVGDWPRFTQGEVELWDVDVLLSSFLLPPTLALLVGESRDRGRGGGQRGR